MDAALGYTSVVSRSLFSKKWRGSPSLEKVLSSSTDPKTPSVQPRSFGLNGLCLAYPECGHGSGDDPTCPGISWASNVFERIASIPVIGLALLALVYPLSRESELVDLEATEEDPAKRKENGKPSPFAFGPATWAAFFTAFHMDNDKSGNYMSSVSYITGDSYGTPVKEVMFVPLGDAVKKFIKGLRCGKFSATGAHAKVDTTHARAQAQDSNQTNFFATGTAGDAARRGLREEGITFGYTTLSVGDLAIFPPG